MSLSKVQSFAISYKHVHKHPTPQMCLVSDFMYASYVLTRVRLSVFHDFLLVLTEGCKFLEGRVFLNVGCLTSLACVHLSHMAQVWVVSKASLYHRPRI